MPTLPWPPRPRPAVVVVLALVLGGCGRLGFDAVGGGGSDGGDAGGVDARIVDAPPGACTWSAWSAPVLLTGVATAAEEWAPALAPDGVTLYFASNRLGGTGSYDLYVATRTSTTAPFGGAVELAQLNTPTSDGSTSFTADGLTLYMTNDIINGTDYLFRATRGSTQAPFGAPTMVGELAGREVTGPTVSADGTELFFGQQRFGYSRLMRSVLVGGVFSAPQPLTELDRANYNESVPTLSPDGRELYYVSLGGGAPGELMVATRSAPGAPFGPATPVTELNSTDDEDDPQISLDGTTMFFASMRAPAQVVDLFMSTRSCL